MSDYVFGKATLESLSKLQDRLYFMEYKDEKQKTHKVLLKMY